jgi:hypothetical protein
MFLGELGSYGVLRRRSMTLKTITEMMTIGAAHSAILRGTRKT